MADWGQDWEPVIGLEIHAQLLTQTKLFCGCETRFGDPPNTHCCPVCLGLPGAMPVLNAEAVRLAIRAALALGCTINPQSLFARKHYFYPDLPKGYQITQLDEPLAAQGALVIQAGGRELSLGIDRLHLEEDAGKNVHGVDGATVIDLNRAGVPLIEIVGEPVLHEPGQAREMMHQLRDELLFAGVSSGSLEQGSLRCDANVSVRRRGSLALGARVELKNINSFRFVAEALDLEIRRQIQLLDHGEPVRQQTRGYNSDRRESYLLRDKEGDEDYRYFPEPDLPPLIIDQALIHDVQAQLPEPPGAKRRRFVDELGVTPAAAEVLTGHPRIASFFEETALLSGEPAETGKVVQRELLRDVTTDGLTASFPVTPRQLAGLIPLVTRGAISRPQAKRVYAAMVGTERTAAQIVAELGLSMESDQATLGPIARQVVAAHPKQAAAYRKGKRGLLGFFVGQVMTATGGRAEPKLASALLAAELGDSEEAIPAPRNGQRRKKKKA